jgi:tryptophan synthase beta chain
MEQRQFLLEQKDIPTQWYNIVADMGVPPAPPLYPATMQPCGPEALEPIFPKAIIEQEMSGTRWMSIPVEVLNALALWRPTPLYRAIRLEQVLNTPAKIFYKYEGTSPVASHKSNTSVAQAYYNKKEGIKRLATETGAGQWGCALAMACSFFQLECTVYMVKVSYDQKPYRKSLMQAFGSSIYPSPSDQTRFGRKLLAENPDNPGSLGIAISEAIEDAVTHAGVKYAIGSVVNHVVHHQTIIGLEAKKQMEMTGEYPDVVIGCVGGGTNFAGIAFPFLADKFNGKNVRALAVEPKACASLTSGEYRYDFGDTAQQTPLLKMYTLGSSFMPPGIHAGGLRYHGMSPLVSQLFDMKILDAVAYGQLEIFDAAVTFARAEGIIPAPESAHAIKAAIDEALQAKEEGKKRVILFNLSGHGMLDLGAYDSYFAGRLINT